MSLRPLPSYLDNIPDPRSYCDPAEAEETAESYANNLVKETVTTVKPEILKLEADKG